MSFKKISISIDLDVFEAIEKMRGTRTQFRSEFVNAVLRKKLGLDKKVI